VSCDLIVAAVHGPWQEYNDRWYYVYDEDIISQPDAKRHCLTLGANLTSILDYNEKNFIYGIM
jgi:hypothetical protein